MNDEDTANPQQYEVTVGGLTGSARDPDLELVLGLYRRSVAAVRWDGAKAILSFTDPADVEQFVLGNDGRRFKQTTLRVELRHPLPAVRPGAAVPSANAPAHKTPAAEKDSASATLEPINPKPVQPGEDRRRPAPYHFVPVRARVMPAAPPVLHDRLDENNWSGELHLTLCALTPLLAANEQYDLAAAVKIDSDVPRHNAFPNSDRLVLRQIPGERFELVCYGRMTSEEQRRYRVLAGSLGLTRPEARQSWEQAVDELFAASQRRNDRAVAAYQNLVAQRYSDARNAGCQAARNVPQPQREVVPDKKLLSPLTMPGPDASSPGAVLINGAALKGLLRHSLAALLSAPLERVAERSSSFRPNLTDAERFKPALVRQCRIEGGRIVKLTVELCTDCADIHYIRPGAVAKIERWLVKKGQLKSGQKLDDLPLKTPRADIDGEIDEVQIDPRRPYAKKVQPAAAGRQAFRGYSLARYREGLDGTSTFSIAFGGADGYRWALVRRLDQPTNRDVPQPVVENYNETVLHVADKEYGHLADHPHTNRLVRGRPLAKLASENIAAFRKKLPAVGDLLFVELLNGEIVGIGHHFRHRRRYRDTVRETRALDFQAGHRHLGPQTLRDILCPRELEQSADVGNQGAPQALTAARLLCGYVGTRDGKYRPSEPLTFGIGTVDGKKTDFSQLAGRLAFNHAVEVLQDPKTTKPKSLGERFLNHDHACLVPLRPLGSPKPSAVEHYLTQDRDRIGRRLDDGILCTYGDTPGDPSAGDLRGRKFYLHQADAARFAEGYSHCFELGVPDPDPPHWDTPPQQRPRDLRRRTPDWRRAEDLEMLLSAQAGIGQFVSRPGSRFRCTLRFVNLRQWELGAVLLTLAPTAARLRALASGLGAAGRHVLEWLHAAEAAHAPDDRADPPRPLLAHKLGHGRPLGMGSVVIHIDGCCQVTGVRRVSDVETQEIQLRPVGEGASPSVPDSSSVTTTPATENVPEWERSPLNELARLLQRTFGDRLEEWINQVFLPWLRVHRYAGTTRHDYPRDLPRKPKDGPADDRGDETIFNYHTNLRQKHARQRKLPANASNRRDQFGLSDLS